MLGLRAWADGLVVVLFEFLDDDTKLAQSCTDWLHVQRWHTIVPEPPMRVTLWALMGHGKDCDAHIEDTPPHAFFWERGREFSRVTDLCTTTANALAGCAAPGVCLPHSIPHLCISVFYVRAYFGSEVQCGSSMASASSRTLLRGEPCPILTLKPLSHRGRLARTKPQTPKEVNQTQRRYEQQSSLRIRYHALVLAFSVQSRVFRCVFFFLKNFLCSISPS